MTNLPILYNNPEDCCGCMACVNICPKNAIEVEEDHNGFKYPKIDSNLCIKCYKCIQVCDFKKNKEDEIKRVQPIHCYGAVNKDTKILKHSSSGGVFSAIAKWVIEEKKGIVAGCVMDNEFNPSHICCDCESSISRMRGSKYVQSDVGYIYRNVKKHLDNGKFVLFTGTPCQCAALYNYLGNRDKYENLLTMDFVCHGVPNITNFKKYISFISMRDDCVIKNINFRSKINGWGFSYSQIEIEKKGRKVNYFIGRNEEYFIDFLSGYLKREADFVCKYASTFRVSDITVGDFWGWFNAGIKLNWGKGLSLLYINSPLAEQVLNSLKLNLQKVDINTTLGNPALNGPASNPNKHYRDYILGLYRENNLIQIYPKRSLLNRLKHFVKYRIPFPFVINSKRIIKKLLRKL